MHISDDMFCAEKMEVGRFGQAHLVYAYHGQACIQYFYSDNAVGLIIYPL